MINNLLVTSLKGSWFNSELLKKDIHNNRIACQKILNSEDVSIDDKHRARITLNVLDTLV